MTGIDLAAQLEGKNLGDELLIPNTMLRSGENVFLCDTTVDGLSEKLGVRITPTGTSGRDFIESCLCTDSI